MSAEQAPSVSSHRRGGPVAGKVPRSARSRLRISDWRMRTKLATVLIIPSLAFLVLATAQTVTLASQATELNEFAREVTVGRQITGLVHELQNERDRTMGELAGVQSVPIANRDLAGLVSSLRPAYGTVDDKVSAFKLAAAPLSGGRAAWRVSYSKSDEALGQLAEVRAAVAGGAVSLATVAGTYGRMIDSLLILLAEPEPGVERPELTDAVLRYVNLSRLKEVASRIRGKLYQAANAGRYGPSDLVELSDLRAQQLTALAEFRVVATEDQIRRYEAAARAERFRAATALEETTFNGTTVLSPQSWWQASQQRLDLLRSVEDGVLGDAVSEADSRSSAQLRETLLVAGIILGILVIALLTSVVIGRSIASSLRALREHALRVARSDLPDTLHRLRSVTGGVPALHVAPAPVRSFDEVGEVADAFLAVHRSAVDLAVEQAAMRRNVNSMFVNLARRSQVLVERQLELLDELEREEADPDQLENLFKLDHLAARMRRNDESLLVLAGNESNRRWSDAVPLSTVVLAAIAEIEFYPRVGHDVDDGLHVVGHAVADLVHLLAELLENATVFSPPDTAVRVTGTDATGGSALLEVTDEGLGMSPEALQEANDLLASPPAADVAASERMGLFVVSHLAARHGIRVQLRAAGRGLVAAVWLPPTLLADSASRPEPAGMPVPSQPAPQGLFDAFAAHGPAAVQPAGAAYPALQAHPVLPGGGALPARPLGGPQVPGPGGAPERPAVPVGAAFTPQQAFAADRVGSQPGAPAATGAPLRYGPSLVTGPHAGPITPAGHNVIPAHSVIPAHPVPAGSGFHDAVTTELHVVTVGPENPARADVVDDEDLPVAGRRPRRVTLQRPTVRSLPPRAENVLRNLGSGPADNAGSAWWSRHGAGAAAARPVAPVSPPPPAVPVTGGVNASGLPVRVPMAQLPNADEATATSAYVPAQRAEPDPAEAGSMLSRFYGGVRRAEAEETIQLSTAPFGGRGREEQQ